MTKTERRLSRTAILRPWRMGSGARVLFVITAFVMLLAQTVSLMCAPQHAEFAPSPLVAAAATADSAAHETDAADACCASIVAAHDARLISTAPAFPSGSGSLPLAASLVFLAVVVPARAAVAVVARPPGIRPYHARSSRILR